MYNKKMKYKHTIFFIVTLLIHLASWYFVICFCSTFINSNKSWIKGVFISLVIDYCVIKAIIPLVKVSLREIMKIYPNCFFKKFLKIWQLIADILRPKRIIR